MNYYLVDYENVKSHGLDGIIKMPPEDVVCIFYSENADTMTFSLHQKLNETQAHVIYEKVEVGTKNALDFQLVTELGYLIRDFQGQEVQFYIVSKDKGYGNTVTYWRKRGVAIAQVIDVSGMDEQKIENDLKAKVEPLVKDKEIVDKVVKMILQYKTKQGINNALMKEFPSSNNKRASELYTAIKPLLQDKKGTVNPQPEPEKAEERPAMPQSKFETKPAQWRFEKGENSVVRITEKPVMPEAKPADAKPAAETKPADAKPAAETKPIEAKPAAEAKPVEANPAVETRHAESVKEKREPAPVREVPAAKASEEVKETTPEAAKQPEKPQKKRRSNGKKKTVSEKEAAEKAAEKAPEKPAEKPVEKPAEKPAEKTAEKPVEKPAEKSADEPVPGDQAPAAKPEPEKPARTRRKPRTAKKVQENAGNPES